MALLMAFTGLLAVSCSIGGDEETAIGGAATPHSDLVCFGDSLTTGYGATDPNDDDLDHAYPAYLKDKLIGSVRVYNAGVSGSMTGFSYMENDTPVLSGTERIDDVLARTPDCVVVGIGANDFLMPLEAGFVSTALYGSYPPPIEDYKTKLVEETQQNLEIILNKLRGVEKVYLVKFFTDGTDGTPDVVQGILELFQYYFTLIGYPETISDDDMKIIKEKFDKMFDNLAAKYDNVELISDIWSGVWDGDSTISADHIHPNAKGYAIQADLYFAAMSDYLNHKGWVKPEYVKTE